jgi:two-component system response regulator GlrR
VKMPTILIVEDEASIRKLAAVNLSARGYDVIAVESAEQGLIQLAAHPIALILLDIKLPGMRGWEFLTAMAGDPRVAPNIPVIIMTASAADAQEKAPGYPNVVRILVKPFSTQVLLQAVAHALQRHGGPDHE